MPVTIVTHQYEFPSENPITTFGAGWTLAGSVTRPLFFGVGTSLNDVITQFNGWQDVGTEAPLTKQVVLHQIEYTRLYGTDVVTITYPTISSDADPVITVTGTITAAERVALTNGVVGTEWMVTNRVHHAVVTLTATPSRKSRTSTNPRFLCGLEAIDYVGTPTSVIVPPLITVPGAPRYIFASLIPNNVVPTDPHFSNVALLMHCDGANQYYFDLSSYNSAVPIPNLYRSTKQLAIQAVVDWIYSNIGDVVTYDLDANYPDRVYFNFGTYYYLRSSLSPITDSSPRPKSITTPNGAVNFTNSPSKFGGGAISTYTPGYPTHQEMVIPVGTTDLQFGSGDFTIEAWVYPTTDFFGPVILLEGQSDLQTVNGSSFIFRFGPSSTSNVYVGPTDYNLGGCPNPNIGEWSHIAFVRRSDTLISFLNGVAISSTTVNGSINIGGSDGSVDTGALTYPNSMFRVDGSGQAMPFDGYVDEVRVTKGVARYLPSTTFTPPTAPFPDQ